MNHAASPGSFEAMLVELVRSTVTEAVVALIPTTKSEGPPPLLDRAGLGRALDVSIATVDRLVRDGCPFLLVLDSRRFEIDVVKAWLRSRSPSANGTSGGLRALTGGRAR